LRPEEEIDPDLPINELGMDSLLAIELRNVLSGLFHRQFPSTILFDYPTLRTLTAYLGKEVLAANQALPVARDNPPSKEIVAPARAVTTNRESALGILESIEQMSDQEVESLDLRS